VILTLAIRSLLARPVRSAVLVGGFGLGVAVMAVLLGVGDVILEQARAPALRGGGDVVIAGASGRLANARFVLASVLKAGTLAPEVVAAAPSDTADLYLFDGRGPVPVRARGGVPSLERALGDPETRDASGWRDTPADREWAAPDPGRVLHDMDRFHPVPDVPARASSWAEWLYFNGRSDTARFYLTFLAGPVEPSGRRTLGVRLQLDRGGAMQSFADSVEIDPAALLDRAPNLAVRGSSVTLDGRDYHLTLDLPAASGAGRVRGTLVLHAAEGRSLPPFVVKGAGGWLSGYVVPVMAGELDGQLATPAGPITFSRAAGYHDHNWGFWDGVSWQWGQVQHGDVSFVYGRLHPPADAADAARIPGFIIAIGPEGPIGFASDVKITETNDPGTHRPRRIVVRGRGALLDVTLDLAIGQTTATAMRGPLGSGLSFLQLRAQYRVTGRAGGTTLDFTTAGSAETFRGE
jgi:hypothetical protein